MLTWWFFKKLARAYFQEALHISPCWSTIKSLLEEQKERLVLQWVSFPHLSLSCLLLWMKKLSQDLPHRSRWQDAPCCWWFCFTSNLQILVTLEGFLLTANQEFGWSGGHPSTALSATSYGHFLLGCSSKMGHIGRGHWRKFCHMSLVRTVLLVSLLR